MDEMKEIVICERCGKEEYYGMMHWYDGKSGCRSCIYEVWKETDPGWFPSTLDYRFPIYRDGKNYTHNEPQLP